jgi:hypothetical protein
MVEYERRIASGELVDGDSFQVLLWPWLKAHFFDNFLQHLGKKSSHLFTGLCSLTQFNNYKGSMRI